MSKVLVEPDFSDSTTGLLEMWKNPLAPMSERLEIADGAIGWRNMLIAKLRGEVEQLKARIVRLECEAKAHDVASVPDGFVMVPAEPTHEMLEALWGRSFDQFDEGGAKKIARIKYQGLLAAAPKADVQEPVAVMHSDGSVMSKADCGIVFDACCRTQTPLYAAPQPVAQEPDIEQIMAKAKELFGWYAGLGGFDDAVRELVAFTAGHRFAPSLPAAPEVKP